MACTLQIKFSVIFTSSSGLTCLSLIDFYLSWLSIQIHPSIYPLISCTSLSCAKRGVGWGGSIPSCTRKEAGRLLSFTGLTHKQHIHTHSHLQAIWRFDNQLEPPLQHHSISFPMVNEQCDILIIGAHPLVLLSKLVTTGM